MLMDPALGPWKNVLSDPDASADLCVSDAKFLTKVAPGCLPEVLVLLEAFAGHCPELVHVGRVPELEQEHARRVEQHGPRT
jgi:hypothetical protein